MTGREVLPAGFFITWEVTPMKRSFSLRRFLNVFAGSVWQMFYDFFGMGQHVQKPAVFSDIRKTFLNNRLF